MTYQQRLDEVTYKSLYDITLKSSGGTLPVICRFATPLGDWATNEVILVLGPAPSALSYLYQQATSAALPALPDNAEIVSISTTGQAYVGYSALKNGTVNSSGPPLSILFSGIIRLGPDNVEELKKSKPLIANTIRWVRVTPTLDTSIYAAGDVLFDTIPIVGAARIADSPTWLISARIIDKDDQTLYSIELDFFSANVSLGTINASASISDANVVNFLDRLTLDGTLSSDPDGVDLGNSKVYSKGAGKSGLPIPMYPANGTDTVYMAGRVVAGTPTHTASGIVIQLGFVDAARGL